MHRHTKTPACIPALRNAMLWGIAILAALSVTSAARAATSVFDGYESPPPVVGSYFDTPGGSTFTDSEGRVYDGHTGIGTNHFGGAARTGSQFLFIENFGDYEASVTQTYSLDPGYYSLSYYEGGRESPYGALTYNLVVDGNIFGSFTTNSNAGSPTVLRTVSNFQVGPSGTTTITFQGTEPNDNDNMGFFDDLSITATTPPSGNLITNGGFESPTVGNAGFTYTNPDNWTASGFGGLVASGAATSAPEGNQVGLIEIFNGLSSSLSQTITFPTAGLYKLTYLDADRPDENLGDLVYDVTLTQGGTTNIATGLNPASTNYGARNFTFLAAAGTGTITFFGAGIPGADRMAYFDAVSVVAVPEPSTFAILMLGAIGIANWGAVRRHRIA